MNQEKVNNVRYPGVEGESNPRHFRINFRHVLVFSVFCLLCAWTSTTHYLKKRAEQDLSMRQSNYARQLMLGSKCEILNDQYRQYNDAIANQLEKVRKLNERMVELKEFLIPDEQLIFHQSFVGESQSDLVVLGYVPHGEHNVQVSISHYLTRVHDLTIPVSFAGAIRDFEPNHNLNFELKGPARFQLTSKIENTESQCILTICFCSESNATQKVELQIQPFSPRGCQFLPLRGAIGNFCMPNELNKTSGFTFRPSCHLSDFTVFGRSHGNQSSIRFITKLYSESKYCTSVVFAELPPLNYSKNTNFEDGVTNGVRFFDKEFNDKLNNLPKSNRHY